MKTKNVVLTTLVVLMMSVMAFAIEPGTPKLVVINQKSGIFKVIYEGSKAGKVSMKIYDKENTEVFSEVINESNGFIRPVNFDGMKAGEYTIEIADAAGKRSQKVTYGEAASVQSIRVSKMSEQGKYLLAVANKGSELISVKIYDGANNLVHNESIAINGDFGMVYDLKKVAGVPTFEISDRQGNVITK